MLHAKTAKAFFSVRGQPFSTAQRPDNRQLTGTRTQHQVKIGHLEAVTRGQHNRVLWTGP